MEKVRNFVILAFFIILAIGNIYNIIRHRKESKEERSAAKAEKKRIKAEKKRKRKEKIENLRKIARGEGKSYEEEKLQDWEEDELFGDD